MRRSKLPSVAISPHARRAHSALLLGTIGLLVGIHAARADENAADTAPSRPADVPTVRGETLEDQRTYHTTFSLHVTGKLRTLVGPGQTASLPLEARAEFTYWERYVPATGATWEQIRSVRFYERAFSEAVVNDRRTRKTLRPDRRTIAVWASVDGLLPVGRDARLNRDELDLLQTPCDSAVLPFLCRRLPAAATPYHPPVWLVPMLTGLEAVRNADVRLFRMAAHDPPLDSAKFALHVTADGAVTGALSTVTGRATITFDTRDRYVRTVEYRQTERRDVGAVSPGLDVTATITIRREPRTPPDEIAARLRQELPDRPSDEDLRIEFRTPWGFHLTLSRDWHLFHQTESVAVLRLVRDGHLIAQCNLSAVPSVRPGTHPSLEEYTQSVRRALGEKLARLERFAAPALPNGIRCLAVLAHGRDRDLNMRWLYYLCTAPDGRQAGLVIAVEDAQWPRVKGAATDLISTLRFD